MTTETKMRKERVKRGLSLRDVADYVGIDHSMLSRLETGDRLPSRAIARKLYWFYGRKVTLADIYDPMFSKQARKPA